MCLTQGAPAAVQFSMRTVSSQLEAGLQCSLPTSPDVWLLTLVHRKAEDPHQEAPSSPE